MQRGGDGAGILLPFLAALLVLGIGAVVTGLQYRHWIAHQRVETTQVAAAHAAMLASRVADSMSAAHTLGALVRHYGGSVPQFPAIAEELTAAVDGLSALSLSPGGVVRQIHPLAGLEAAVGRNVLEHGPDANAARRAMTTGQLTIAGPFPLDDGALAVVGRNPVYLQPAADEPPRFWGFTGAFVRLEDLTRRSGLDRLLELGASYRLMYVDPVTGELLAFASAGPEPSENGVDVQVPVPNQQWILRLGLLQQPGSRLTMGLVAALVVATAGVMGYGVYQIQRQPVLLRRQVEERTRALATEQALLDAILDCAPDMVFYKDLEGRYRRCNQALAKALGLPREEILGRADDELLDPAVARELRARDRQVLATGRPVSYEFTLRTSKGRTRSLHTLKAPFRKPDGSVAGFVGVTRDVSERKRREQEVWRQANFDGLTGLPNRRLFEDRLRNAVGQAARRGTRIAVLFLDLDRFKRINDAMGQTAGDAVLQIAAERLAAELRDADTVARLSGDEFTAVLVDISDAEQLARVAERLLESLSQPAALRDRQVSLSCSIGIAVYPTDGEDAESLLDAADRAMYAAKEAGRGTWRAASADSLGPSS